MLATLTAALAWAWSRYIARRARNIRRWGSPEVAALAARAMGVLGGALGVTGFLGKSEHAALPSGTNARQSLVVSHPHGLYLFAPLFVVAQDATKRESPWYGLFTAAADAVFQVPVFREFVLLVLGRQAGARTIDSILASGHTVSIFPGGIHEQLATDPKQERCFFPPNLGFVRQAIKFGIPLQPCYNFGENQLFDIPPWTRTACRMVKQYTGAGVPLGVGRWGLPFLPKKQNLQCHAGFPVEVGPADPNPTDERVKQVFRMYCTELRRLFNEHKDAALPPEVAARGLDIVWRGHKSEELFEDVASRPVSLPLITKKSGRVFSRVQSEPIISVSRL